MNPTLAVWLASLLGAGLFFLSGVFFARFRSASTPRGVAPADDERSRSLPSAQQDLAAAEAVHREAEARLGAREQQLTERRHDVEQREAALAAAESRLASVKQEKQQVEQERQRLEQERQRIEGDRQRLEGARQGLEGKGQRLEGDHQRLQSDNQRLQSDNQRLQGELQRLQSDNQRHQSDLQRTRSELAAATPLAGEVAALRSELQARAKSQAPVPAAVTNELASLKAALEERTVERDRLLLEVAAQKNRVTQLSGLQNERHDLLQRLEDAERVINERVDRKELADAKYELTMKGHLADARLVESNRLSEENAQLRASVSEMGRLKDRVDELSRDLQEAKAQRLTPTEVGRREQLQAGGGHRLQRLVDRVAHLDGVRSVAVADAQGFVVAGFGEHADGLGAFSAFLIAAAARAAGVLPFRSARRLVLEDEGTLMLSSYRLPIGDHDLVLSLLTVGNEPAARTINELVDDTTVVSHGENSVPITERDANAEA
ncbi:MAG: hypothetical protein IT383_29475 [Deltaproteobacteria bacterium]|nr:hypothetical protein [Deltaproteobacteria bacterium]